MAVDALSVVTLDTFGEAELDELEPRSAHILRMRSGMAGSEKHTFPDIGDELGGKGERVRRFNRSGWR